MCRRIAFFRPMYIYFEITQAFNDNALLVYGSIFLNIALSASYISYIIIAVKVIGRYYLLF